MTEPYTKSFLRPGKIILLLVFGLLVYGITLALWVPAGWVWQQVASQVPLPPEVQVQQVSGQLWGGAASVVVVGYPARVDWRLGWPSVTDPKLPVAINVQTAKSALQGDLTLAWPLVAELNASGHLGIAEFRELIRDSGGAMIEGDVIVDRLSLSWANDRLDSAAGLVRWAGGNVTWPMGNQTGSAVFPPMQGKLDTTNNGMELTIGEQGNSGPAARVDVSLSGLMDIRVFKRMVDLAGQSWAEAASPDDVVFRVRQPLIPAGR